MPVNYIAEEFEPALRQVNQAAPSSTPASGRGNSLAASDWQKSEQFRVRVITARTKLKLMRDRSDALRDSLQRFREQQGYANSA